MDDEWLVVWFENDCLIDFYVKTAIIYSLRLSTEVFGLYKIVFVNIMPQCLADGVLIEPSNLDCLACTQPTEYPSSDLCVPCLFLSSFVCVCLLNYLLISQQSLLAASLSKSHYK